MGERVKDGFAVALIRLDARTHVSDQGGIEEIRVVGSSLDDAEPVVDHHLFPPIDHVVVVDEVFLVDPLVVFRTKAFPADKVLDSVRTDVELVSGEIFVDGDASGGKDGGDIKGFALFGAPPTKLWK